MITFFRISIFFVIIIVDFVAFETHAQTTKKIELLHANSLEYDEAQGVKVKRLLGNVGFKHEEVLMYCDSAYLYNDGNKLDAFGNVRILPDSKTSIYGDSLFYNGTDKIAKLFGNIVLNEGTKKLTTNRLDFLVSKNLAYYSNNGVLTDSKEGSVLTSLFGYYYTKQRKFFFRENVHLDHPDYTITSDSLMHNTESEITYFLGPSYIKNDSSTIYCENGWFDAKRKHSVFKQNAFIDNKNQKIEGDSIFYDRNKFIGEAMGNVTITDTAERMVVTGNYIKYFEKDSVSYVTGKVLLTQYYDDDTLYLHADTLFTTYDSTKTYRILHAFHKAKFFKSDMQGMSDSLVFSDADSTLKLFYKPVIWSRENQMTADFIEIRTYNGKVDFMTFEENAFIISEEDTSKYNQIKGKNMFGYFKDNELYKVDVVRNGQTIYYAREDDKKSYIGVNIADCDKMVIRVENKNVEGITFLSATKAVLYPLDGISSEETILRGFKWYDSYRPQTQKDVFNWHNDK